MFTHKLPENYGCDDPEDSIWAGATVTVDTPWREGSQRELILITDADSHVRSCPEFCVDGKAPTLQMWQDAAAASTVNVTIVNAAPPFDPSGPWEPGTDSFEDMAQAFGCDPTEYFTTSSEYSNHLAKKIVFKAGEIQPDMTIIPTLTITYADGTTSTDVTALLTPAGATIITAGGDPVSFTITAHAVDAINIAKAGAITSVYVEYTIKETTTIVARQTITFTTPALLVPSGGTTQPQPGFATLTLLILAAGILGIRGLRNPTP
jgi:hypothetical protein